MWCLILVIVITSVSSYSTDVDEVFTPYYQEVELYYYLNHDNVETQELIYLYGLQLGEVGKNNVYLLYTRRNMLDAQEIVYNDLNSLKKTYFNPAKDTVFLIHGWFNSRKSPIDIKLTEAFLQNNDVNVIVVDWSHASKDIIYPRSVAAVTNVGQYIGNFINWLTTYPINVSYNKVHVVGHSLGAHVAGSAGRATRGQVRRITALDPAGPLFYYAYASEGIRKTDAQYVEVIHTNSKFYGYKYPCGHADFYPNGGDSMPECFLYTCSHSQSYEYMALSVKFNALIARECRTMDEVEKDTCKGISYPMGNSDLTKNRSGLFRVNTAKKPWWQF